MKKVVLVTGVDGYNSDNVAQSAMTVQKLIAVLQEFDPEARVVASVQDGYAFSAVRAADFHSWD